MSRISPWTSQTAWQFCPYFFFLPQWNSPKLHPALSQSFWDGLCIQRRIPSVAPAQQSNPALETLAKPQTKDCCMLWSSDCKAGGVSVDVIHNVPAAVDCVGVTNTVCGHNIIRRTTSKPSKGTCKPDIGWNWSIWNVECCTFLPRCSDDIWTKHDRKTEESSILYSVCPSEIHFAKSLVNVLDGPNVALENYPSWERS